jgi:adenylate cyclase
MHYTVEFNSDRLVEISEGQTLLDASLSAGIPHFHVCGGKARCSTCRVLILEGIESLSLPNKKEGTLRQQMHFPSEVRLACQTYVKGEGVKLTRIIRDESDIQLYVGSEAAVYTQNMGKEKELAVFFLDIRNFTEFVATHLAFDIIHIMRKLFHSFHAVIEKHEGKIIETLGDGLYAIFGFHKGIHESTDAAIKAGYEILEELEQMNKEYFLKNFDHNIEIGIGIHAGMVVSGNIKLGDKKHLLVMGYPVNVASRLQNATKTLNNNFIVSEDAFNFSCEPSTKYPVTTVQLKGIAEPVRVYLMGKAYS